MSDSLQPHRLKPAKLPSPWNSPGGNTGVGCHCLLQGIFLTRDRTRVFHIAGRFFTTREWWPIPLATRECPVIIAINICIFFWINYLIVFKWLHNLFLCLLVFRQFLLVPFFLTGLLCIKSLSKPRKELLNRRGQS